MYANNDVVILGDDVAIPDIGEGITATGMFDMDLTRGWNQVYSKVEMTLSLSEAGLATTSVVVTYKTDIPPHNDFAWLLGTMLNMGDQIDPPEEEGENGE